MDFLMRCTAKSKRSGQQCKKDAVIGGEKCHMQGGKSLRGVAHPRFKHGRDSKFTLMCLQGFYERNLKDETILHLLDEIAMTRAMIQEMMNRCDSSIQWKDAKKSWQAFERAEQRDDRVAMRGARREHATILEEGEKDWQNRLDIFKGIDWVRRLVDSEHKHRIDQRMAVTQEQLANYVAAIVGILTNRIKDRKLLNAITGDLLALDEELSEPGHG
jgi:hypothetical protein